MPLPDAGFAGFVDRVAERSYGAAFCMLRERAAAAVGAGIDAPVELRPSR